MDSLPKGQDNCQPNFSDRRKYKRVAILATFCIFITEGAEEPDGEKTPFLSAGLYDISLGGAQFCCESMTACSPFCDTERKIKKDSTIWLVPNRPADNPSPCSGGCSCSSIKASDADGKIDILGNDPIEAKVMWINGDRFGCMFVNPAEGFTRALERIIDDILCESGIEL